MTATTLCQDKWCTKPATQEISAEGTSHGYQVCGDPVHVRWAKQELAQDFPGRRIEQAFIAAPELCASDEPIDLANTVVTYVGDDDADGW